MVDIDNYRSNFSACIHTLVCGMFAAQLKEPCMC